MKKRYDLVVVGGGVAGYALAALASQSGSVLFFENEDPPLDPPWERPLLADGEGSVWNRFASSVALNLKAAAPFRLQVLDGRARGDGRAPARAGAALDPAWLERRIEWPAWYVRLWRRMAQREGGVAPEPGPWLRYPLGVVPDDVGVRAYLAAVRERLSTPAGSAPDLLLALRSAAGKEATEFLPIGRFDGLAPGGIKVEGAGRVIETERVAVCLDLGQWSMAPGLGPLPRSVFKQVRPSGVRVRARWACRERELPVGLAARGWWQDAPQAFFEVSGAGDKCSLSAFTTVADGTAVDAREVAGAMLAVVRRYCPFFQGQLEGAQVSATPLWRAVREGAGVPPVLRRGLGYAGPQSFPGWGVEGELVAALRLARHWFAQADERS